MVVYLITNIVNGKRYVGKTVRTLDVRWRAHLSQMRRQENSALHRALLKYGPDVFERRVISQALNTEVLAQLETFWIRELRTKTPNGYNLTDGGEGSSGYRHDAAAIEKMSHPRSPEGCANIRAACQEPARKERIVQIVKNNHPWRGRHHTAETIDKIRRIANDPAHLARSREISLGRKRSSATRKHMSRVRKAVLAKRSPEESTAIALRGWETRRANAR
jgi:group I intron endonuclease